MSYHESDDAMLMLFRKYPVSGASEQESRHKAQNLGNKFSVKATSGSCETSSDSFSSSTRLIRTRRELSVVKRALHEADLVAIDLETTGLNTRRDRVRLLSLAVSGAGEFLIDCFAVDPAPLWAALTGKRIIGHNLLFDLRFLVQLGFTPSAPVQDTMVLSQLLYAGEKTPKGFHGLGSCLQRELGITIDKAQQSSKWAGALSAKQIAYAAGDVAHLHRLRDAFASKIEEAGLKFAAKIERRCLPALVWLSGTGVAFDREAWGSLAAAAERKASKLERRLDEHVPGVNWKSPKQVKKAFDGLGITLQSTNDDTLASLDHPLASLLRRHRAAVKNVTTYGTEWASQHADGDGRVYCDWRQLGAITGRMSSSSPNLQNLPRNAAYRRCFVAPPGRVLVKADYSQIELRIAAKVSGDEAMIRAYRKGADLHTLTAQRLLGTCDVDQDSRQLAKAVNFGLLYGQGVDGFRRCAKSVYNVELRVDHATQLRDGFFRAYPGLAQWHTKLRRSARGETRTLAGRRVLVPNDLWYGARANFIVQGTGGDGIKLALALLWERRAQAPGAFTVLVVHDEIVVECDKGKAKAVETWLRQAMLDAMEPLLDPVPVEVEVTTSATWGGD